MKLPKNWKDISIKQFVEISKITQKGGDDIDVKVKLLSSITGLPESHYLNMEYKGFNKLINSLAFLNDLKINEKLLYSFKVDGIKFEIVHDISKLTAAEYVDLCTFIGTKEKVQENLHKIVAIFCKPKSKWFGLKKVYMKRSEIAELLLNKMPITVAYPLCVFFCEVLNASTKITKDYLARQMAMVIQEAKAAGLLKNGAGT